MSGANGSPTSRTVADVDVTTALAATEAAAMARGRVPPARRLPLPLLLLLLLRAVVPRSLCAPPDAARTWGRDVGLRSDLMD